jgi:hypothetical protein
MNENRERMHVTVDLPRFNARRSHANARKYEPLLRCLKHGRSRHRQRLSLDRGARGLDNDRKRGRALWDADRLEVGAKKPLLPRNLGRVPRRVHVRGVHGRIPCAASETKGISPNLPRSKPTP